MFGIAIWSVAEMGPNTLRKLPPHVRMSELGRVEEVGAEPGTAAQDVRFGYCETRRSGEMKSPHRSRLKRRARNLESPAVDNQLRFLLQC